MAALVRCPHVRSRLSIGFTKIYAAVKPNSSHVVRSYLTSPICRITNLNSLRSGRKLAVGLHRENVKVNRLDTAGLCGALFSRLSSQHAADGGLGSSSGEEMLMDSGYLPTPPPIPEPGTITEGMTQTLNALGEPTLSSLGFCNYTPVGAVQTALDFLHVSCNLPWWGAIMAATLCIRLMVFPLVILSQKNAAKMQEHGPTMRRLQNNFNMSRRSGDQMKTAKAAEELTSYMKRNDIKVLRNFMVPMVQAPIFISMFLGLRQLAVFPIESMSTGGLFWFTDLTLADPIFALPLLTSVTLLATIEIGSDGIDTSAMPMGHTMKWFLRAMPVIMFPVIMKFPAAMLCYWLSTNTFSLCQVLFLKIPAVRRFFKIPALIKHEKVDKYIKKRKDD